MLRILICALLLLLACTAHAHAAVPGCAGSSRIAGCHALVQTPRGALTEVSLSYVIAQGLGYVQPRVERGANDVVRVYFIDSDYALRTPSETRLLPLGAFAPGSYRIEIYEGHDGPVPPPLQPAPPQQVATLGLAIAGAVAVPAIDRVPLLTAALALALLGVAALRRR